jgi:hypothetical protein
MDKPRAKGSNSNSKEVCMQHRIIPSLIAFAALLGAPALAEVPTTIQFQGYLSDLDDSPSEGFFTMAFGLYAEGEGGEPVWSETREGVEVAGGQFNLRIGDRNPLSPELFRGAGLYLSVSVEGDEILPRHPVSSVTHAFVAAHADDVRGRAIHPGSVSIGDEVVIDENGRWVGDPSGLQGPQGERGAAGQDGAQGATGETGAQGERGETGATGDQGAVGAQGDRGPIGVTGAQGDRGPIGVTGAQGDPGAGHDLTCQGGEMLTWTNNTWACSGHASDVNAHHSSTSDNLALTPASVQVRGTSTRLTDGQIDLGPGADDHFTANMVTTLTGGGDADALHQHAGAGGGVCYNAVGTNNCAQGFDRVLSGEIVFSRLIHASSSLDWTTRDGISGKWACMTNPPTFRGDAIYAGFVNGRRAHNPARAATCAICCK